MTDSELLMHGREALHEAHVVGTALAQEIHDKQKMGQPVKGQEYVAQFRAVRERAQLVVSAFLELEQRALGVAPAKVG